METVVSVNQITFMCWEPIQSHVIPPTPQCMPIFCVFFLLLVSSFCTAVSLIWRTFLKEVIILLDSRFCLKMDKNWMMNIWNDTSVQFVTICCGKPPSWYVVTGYARHAFLLSESIKASLKLLLYSEACELTDYSQNSVTWLVPVFKWYYFTPRKWSC